MPTINGGKKALFEFSDLGLDEAADGAFSLVRLTRRGSSGGLWFGLRLG